MRQPEPAPPRENCQGCPLLNVSVKHRINTINSITPKSIECTCWATGDLRWEFLLSSKHIPDYAHKINLIHTITELMNGYVDHPLVDDLRDRVPPYPCTCTMHDLLEAARNADDLRSVQGRTLANRTRWQEETTLFTQATEIHARIAGEAYSRKYHQDKE
jgi:hypothetical protein